MTETVDIVKLVEDNPLTKFNKLDYQSKLVDKLRNKFSTDEQQLFLASFYCYLNCDPKEFIVSLRDHWKWLGFGRIEECKRVLTKNFSVDKDYKIVFRNSAENSKGVGRPSEDIKMTVRCFKKLCLKSRTDKADEIHDYYLDLEETMHELIEEESEQLRDQLICNTLQYFFSITT